MSEQDSPLGYNSYQLVSLFPGFRIKENAHYKEISSTKLSKTNKK